jgi:quercetin dioxygenase-like cupin family protein
MTAELHVPAGTGETVWVGEDVYTLKATSASTAGRLSLVEASVPAGAGPPPHVHPDADEAFYVLAGELEMLAGDRTFYARTGDFVFVHRGTTHRFANIGLHTMRMIFFHVPGGFDGFLSAVGTPARPSERPDPREPEDMKRGAQIGPEYGVITQRFLTLPRPTVRNARERRAAGTTPTRHAVTAWIRMNSRQQ